MTAARRCGNQTGENGLAILQPDHSGETNLADDITTETSQTVAAGQLRAFIERIERLEEEKKTIADDIKEVYAEMKGTGFDTKAVRTIVRLRKQDQAERQEAEAMIDLYKNALGMA